MELILNWLVLIVWSLNYIKYNKKDLKKGLVPYLFMILVALGIFYVFNVMNQDINNLTYNEFIGELSDNKVKEIEITPRDRAQTYEVTGKLKSYSKKEKKSQPK